MKASKPEAYQLLHDGSLTLSQVEANGIKIDTEYLKGAIHRMESLVEQQEQELEDTDVYKTWKRRYRSKTKLGSRKQLGKVLYDDLGVTPPPVGEDGASLTDDSALEKLHHPFVEKWIRTEKYKKVRNNFLENIRKEVTREGLLHAFYNLHIAKTFRSSSDSPNFQNFPVRDKELSEIVRKCFVARNNKRCLVEIDYSGIEVRIAACYHKDPKMLEYIKDPTKDMHRDMAAQCYACEPSDVSKDMRYCAKNQFVFPQFYGDYYINCARSLWQSIEHLNLKFAEGSVASEKVIEDHLIMEGIAPNGLGECDPKKRPKKGTFEHHIQKVEKDFWNNRFKVYNQWKRDWWSRYQKTGGFETLTGFAFNGILGKNDAINYPVQGSAFHCLLWALIRLNKWLRKKKMKTRIVGQIHDSIIADVYLDELDDYLEMAKKIMTVDLPKYWTWINVPLEVEAEVTPPGGSWFEKKETLIW